MTRIKDQRAATAALRRSLKFVNSLFVCLFLFSFIVYSTVGKTICEWTGRGRGVGQKQQHWPKGYADLNRAESPPAPGGLGTRSLLASPLIKTATTTFAWALLGSYSGSHSKCSIISGRVLKKPHVKTCDFETTGGDLLERGIVHATCA